MPISIRVANATAPITAVRVLIGGVLRPVKTIRMLVAGELKTIATFASPLTLALVPANVGSRGGGSSSTLTTRSMTATPSGGSGPFTYAWSSADPQTFVNSPTMATTTFSRFMEGGDTQSTPISCTVTDASGETASADGQATFNNINTGGLQ